MAFTQADLDALNSAIVGQHLEVEYQGRRVRFRSVAELQAAYRHVKAELATSTSAASRTGPYRFSFTTSRGD